MIPCIVPMAEDELFMPWLGCLADLNGMDAGMFSEMFLPYGGSAYYGKRLYPALLEEVCKRHGGMDLFPGIYDIIEKHTLFRVSSLCLPYAEKARMLEEILRGKWQGHGITQFRMCGACRMEDREKYGREAVHAIHQMPEILVCPYHGCALEGIDIKEGQMEQERRIAAYVLAFYRNGACYGREQAQHVIDLYLEAFRVDNSSLIAEAHAAGYIRKPKRALYQLEHPASMPFGEIYRLLTYMTGTAEAFLKTVPPDDYRCGSTQELELLEEKHGLGKYKCRRCGHEFYRHGYAVEKGMLCPSCRGRLSESEYADMLAGRYSDGSYVYLGEKRAILKHRYCGTLVPARDYFWLYPWEGCAACQKKQRDWDRVLRPYGYVVTGFDGKYLNIRHSCGEEFRKNEDVVRRHGKTGYATMCPECRKIVYRENRKRKAAVG